MIPSIDKDSIKLIESQRLETQRRLDAQKSQAERNKLGQFATPPGLATEILEYAQTLMFGSNEIRFLDPAIGTGSFFAALLRAFPPGKITKAWGYEIDPHYGQAAQKLWSNTLLELNIADFTQANPPKSEKSRANLLICNPPYVRHHHLSADEKIRLQTIVKQATGFKLSGLAGLYCYFLLTSHQWMSEGGLGGWLIPSEFMDVNYGKQVKQFLLQQVTLLRIHRFKLEEVQFGDALVSSAIVWLRKQKPPANHEVQFSYGGSLARPERLQHVPAKRLVQAAKWTRFSEGAAQNQTMISKSIAEQPRFKLADLFQIKRGLVTGANKLFLLTPDQIKRYELPDQFLIPILPSPRYLPTDEIKADDTGNPILEQRLFLLTCDLPESEVKSKYPPLWRYLQTGIRQNIHNRYLCRNRSPWYSQEKRLPSPLLCTYMGRQSKESRKPFRFILNHSAAIAPNVYLMLYPKSELKKELSKNPELLRTVWHGLNQIDPNVLMGEGRSYGGGLHKIEPNELANAPIDTILATVPELSINPVRQLSLFD